MATHRTLQDLTGCESGLVLYHESHEAICCNWTSIHGLPRVFVTGVIGLGEEIPDVKGGPLVAGAIQEILEAFTLVHDESNGEVLTETATATAYEIGEDVTVVTFEGWN